MTDDRYGTWYGRDSDEGRAVAEYDRRHVAEVEPKFEPVRRSKNVPPLAKRVAKRRRRKKLADHHRKVMKAVAAGHKGPHPKRPPKPRAK